MDPFCESSCRPPDPTDRNFYEVLRVLDSIQLTAAHTVATPPDWRPGEDVIISPAVSGEEAKHKFPGGRKTLEPSLLVTRSPQ